MSFRGICFTGKLTLFTRNEARSAAKKAGYWPCDSVNSWCEYLVMADPNSNSNKAKAARQKGVKLLSETDFLDMIHMTAEEVKELSSKKKEEEKKRSKTWQQCLKKICKNLGLKASIVSDEYSLSENKYVTFIAKVWLADDDKNETSPFGTDSYFFHHCQYENSIFKKPNAKSPWGIGHADSKEEAAYRLIRWLFEGFPKAIVEDRGRLSCGFLYSEKEFDEKQKSDPNSRYNRLKALSQKIPLIEVSSIEELELQLECFGWDMVTE